MVYIKISCVYGKLFESYTKGYLTSRLKQESSIAPYKILK